MGVSGWWPSGRRRAATMAKHLAHAYTQEMDKTNRAAEQEQKSRWEFSLPAREWYTGGRKREGARQSSVHKQPGKWRTFTACSPGTRGDERLLCAKSVAPSTERKIFIPVGALSEPEAA